MSVINQSIELLKFSEHADLRLLPVQDYSAMADKLTAPIVIDEIGDIAREYPIVFPKGSALPSALLGVQHGANAYVSPNGRWRAAYIPSFIRHFPMTVMRFPPVVNGKEDQHATEPVERLAIAIDTQSQLVSRLEGTPVFEDDGSFTAETEAKVALLKNYNARRAVTEHLVRAIENAGVLVERSIQIKLESEVPHRVSGLRVIDEAALNMLSKDRFEQLRRQGALPLIYASLIAWANFEKGPIGQSHKLKAG